MRLWYSHRRIRIKKGRHRPSTFLPSVYSKKWIAGEIRKSELSKYYIEGEDKWDWNKDYGIGTVSKCWMHNDSIMVASRFIPEKDAWEYTYYAHTSCADKPIYGKPLFTASLFDKPRFQLAIDGNKLKFWLQKSPDDEVHYFEFDRTSKCKWSRRIKGWQGGTTPATNEIIYYVVESKKPIWEIK